MVTLVLFAALFIFMFLGMPIAIALGLSSVISILLFSSDSIASVALKLYAATSEHYTLLAIPFFILSSAFLSTGGVANRIIHFATDCVGHIRGGLAMASVLACTLFAAVSGSSPATVAAIGTIVIAGMIKEGYPKSFAAGIITTSGTLGILIPPSIVMLVYAAATEVSATRMFMAGVLPGLMMSSILMLAIYIVARRKQLPARTFPGITSLFLSGGRAMGGLMLVVIVLGAIYGGIASPTEAAAVAAIYAFLIAIFLYRDIGPLKNEAWRKQGEALPKAIVRNTYKSLLALPKSIFDKEVNQTVMDAVKVSIMLLFIIANAMLFAHVLTSERIPHAIASFVIEMGLPVWAFLILVNVLLLIAGNFMEPTSILLIMAPILFPIATQLGVDPIHLGIIMVVNMEIGLLTPPVGLNLFVTSGITKENIVWVIKSTLPWLSLMLLFLALITYIPQISLALPNYLDQLNGY